MKAARRVYGVTIITGVALAVVGFLVPNIDLILVAGILIWFSAGVAVALRLVQPKPL